VFEPTARLPELRDVETPDSFGAYALSMAPKNGASLVLAPLDIDGVPTGDLVIVENLSPDPEDRARLFSDHVLYLYVATAKPWNRLAYAIVEPDGTGSVAYVRFAARTSSLEPPIRPPWPIR
jgi:hypothetical protein